MSDPEVRRVRIPRGEATLRRAPAGYWTVWPRPTREELERLYRHDYYVVDKPFYVDKTRSELPYWRGVWDLRARVIAAALGAPRGRLLDVGASAGFLLDHFRDRGWEVAGIEPAREPAEHARKEFGLEVFCGFLDDYPGPGGFDVVHCSLVLEHVLEPEAFVARVAALLRPGGVAFVETPNDFNPFQAVVTERLEKPAWWVVPEHHLNYFDFESLSALLAAHGLEEVDRLASWPMELFLLMGRDYVGNDPVGRACHAERMALEGHLFGSGRADVLERLYRALARSGLGRTCCLVARKGPAAGAALEAAA